MTTGPGPFRRAAAAVGTAFETALGVVGALIVGVVALAAGGAVLFGVIWVLVRLWMSVDVAGCTTAGMC